MTAPYQVLPDLPPEEFADLKADIEEHGLRYPPVVDENGTTIDGHQRRRALEELGRDYHTIVLPPGLSDADKRTEARRLNLLHRQVSQEQRRGLIADQLKDTPDWADNRIAAVIGVSDHTVAAVRGELEANFAIAKLEAHEGADGRLRAKRRPIEIAKNRHDRQVTQRLLGQCDPTILPAEVLDVRGLGKAVNRQGRAANGEAEGDATVGTATLLLGDFREKGAAIADASVDLIFCDPPYTQEWLPNWVDLGEFAARVLRREALCVTYLGNTTCLEAIDGLRQHLRLHIAGALWTPGPRAKLFSLNVYIRCKPLFFWTRRDFVLGSQPWFFNGFESERLTKTYHRWQQGIAPARYYIETLTRPGDLVVDPFLGGGTTGVAALQLGRSFVGIEIDAVAMATATARIREAEAARLAAVQEAAS